MPITQNIISELQIQNSRNIKNKLKFNINPYAANKKDLSPWSLPSSDYRPPFQM